MKKLFTVFVFVLVFGLTSTTAFAQMVRKVSNKASVPFEVAPCPNGPIFYVKQVSNFLLDGGYGRGSGFGGGPRIGIGGGSSSSSTISQQWMNPQLMLEAFNREFQSDGCIGSLDNRVRETGQYGGYYVNQVATVNYPVPATKDPKVYFPVMSGKVLATRNSVKFGPSRKQQVTGAVINAGTVVFACRRSGEIEEGLCVAGQLLSRIILAGSKNTELREQKMEVTVQFQNAATGYLRTLTGEVDYYTSENNEVAVFMNHTSGTFEVFSMKDALVAAMEDIRIQFVAANASVPKPANP